jgi:hypothetical protein
MSIRAARPGPSSARGGQLNCGPGQPGTNSHHAVSCSPTGCADGSGPDSSCRLALLVMGRSITTSELIEEVMYGPPRGDAGVVGRGMGRGAGVTRMWQWVVALSLAGDDGCGLRCGIWA